MLLPGATVTYVRFHGAVFCVRQRLDLDERLLRAAQARCGALTIVETIERALRALVAEAPPRRRRRAPPGAIGRAARGGRRLPP